MRRGLKPRTKQGMTYVNPDVNGCGNLYVRYREGMQRLHRGCCGDTETLGVDDGCSSRVECMIINSLWTW